MIYTYYTHHQPCSVVTNVGALIALAVAAEVIEIQGMLGLLGLHNSREPLVVIVVKMMLWKCPVHTANSADD